MPKVEKHDIDHLNASITVTLEKSEYEPKFKSELKKYQKQANMKGFRKGRTPMSILKKMYGQSVLADVINEMLQKELYEFLDAQDFNILGQPLPSEDQKQQDIDVKSMKDYEFKFDLGISPDFELKGTDESASYDKMVVDITEEMIDEDFQAARKRHGSREAVEGEIIQDNDMVKLKAIELEGDAPKADGIETEFSILVSDNTMDALKEELKSKKAGDTIRFNINEVEEGRDETYTRKYYLNLEDGDERDYNETFEATIEEVNRIAPAEMNQAFFDQAFGEGVVDSEEAARNHLREQMQQFYNRQAEALASRDIQESLIEQNEMEFPEAFLKRWMKAVNEGVDDETVEKEYDNFRQNLKWSLIRNKLVEQYGIELTEQDIIDAAKRRIMNYFGGQMMPGMEEVVNGTAMRMLQDEKQVEQLSQEVLTDRVFEVLLEKVTLEDKTVSLEEFEEEVKKAQEQNQSQEEEE
jgi:trigger factor